MQKDFIVNNSNEAVSECLDFVRGQLEGMKVTAKALNRAVLMTEEAAARLCEHADFSETGRIRVIIRKFLGNITVKMIVPGSEFKFSGGLEDVLPDDDDDTQSGEILRNILLHSFGNNITYKHSRKYNIVTIRAVRSDYSKLYTALEALVLSVAAGLLLRNTEAGAFLNSSIFMPVSKIFMNGLKTCAVPIVFYSVLLCVADAGNMSELRKSGARVMFMFLMLQVIAVLAGFGIAGLVGVGKGAGLVPASQASAGNASLSIADIVIDIMPGNIERPFLEANMLQIMFLAFLIGLAISATGSEAVRKVFTELNRIFMKISSYIIKFMPLAIFCVMASTVITTGVETVLSLLGLLLTFICVYCAMNIILCLAVRFIAGLNPAVMYRKSIRAIITGFMTCSTSAAIPDMMESSEALGIPSKLYSFSVPIGATLFKTGMTVSFAVAVIAASNMYGVNIPFLRLVTLGVSIIIVTIATPSMPGAAIISMSVIMTQAGCPLEFISLLMSIDTIRNMFATPTSCMGNITAGVITSRLEGKLDIEGYNRP